MVGASVVAQPICEWWFRSCWPAWFPVQFPANASEKTAEDGPSTEIPAHHRGDLYGIPDSSLQHCPHLTIIPIWRVNQQVKKKNLALFSLSLCHSNKVNLKQNKKPWWFTQKL